jgi:uncharacterized protein (DUF305 family)
MTTKCCLVLAFAVAACRTTTPAVAPASPRPAPPDSAAAPVHTTLDSVAHRTDPAPAVDPDTRFMQGMIVHHAQAVAMVALIPTHTNRADLALLGQRIDVSQRDEIAMMRRWLQDHHREVPVVDPQYGHENMAGHDMMTMSAMPGMLSREQMTRLESATGAAFDTLFLQGMIQHHEGALTMVAQLFATPGAGQQSQVFAFASDVDADQRAEINRMRALLDKLSVGARRPPSTSPSVSSSPLPTPSRGST